MAEGSGMVHLRTVPDAWHAKVLAARLGAEGILTHLQGPVSGPWPFGAVAVHVEEGQAELAAELLMADEVESAFSQHFSSVTRLRHHPDDILPGDGGRPELDGDDLQVLFEPGDDVDLRAFDPWADSWAAAPVGHHRLMSRKGRALAAFAALVVAGAPVLAHFVGQ